MKISVELTDEQITSLVGLIRSWASGNRKNVSAIAIDLRRAEVSLTAAWERDMGVKENT